jgi:protein-S-isoprenylcysteine O-methyltransferase Ste14
LLLCDVVPRWTCAAAAALFTVFIAWILYLQWRHAPVGCGCGGGLSSPVETSLATGRIWSGIRSATLLSCSVVGILGSELPRRPIIRHPHTEGDTT